MTDAQPLWNQRRFWIGFLGGISPYLMGFATLCYSVAEYSLLPPLSTSLLEIVARRITAVGVFSFIGGIAAVIWGAKEKDLQRLFVIGMSAPAIIASVGSSNRWVSAGAVRCCVVFRRKHLVLCSLDPYRVLDTADTQAQS